MSTGPVSPDSVAKAATEIGTTFASAGERGLIIYALLLVIMLLLIFMFAMAGLTIRAINRQSQANEKLANNLFSVGIALARVESAVGIGQFIRDRDKAQTISKGDGQ